MMPLTQSFLILAVLIALFPALPVSESKGKDVATGQKKPWFTNHRSLARKTITPPQFLPEPEKDPLTQAIGTGTLIWSKYLGNHRSLDTKASNPFVIIPKSKKAGNQKVGGAVSAGNDDAEKTVKPWSSYFPEDDSLDTNESEPPLALPNPEEAVIQDVGSEVIPDRSLTTKESEQPLVLPKPEGAVNQDVDNDNAVTPDRSLDRKDYDAKDLVNDGVEPLRTMKPIKVESGISRLRNMLGVS